MNPPLPDNVIDLRESLQYKDDQLITNPHGERVYLKALFVGGQRVGLTDCCFEYAPCEWHYAIAGLKIDRSKH